MNSKLLVSFVFAIIIGTITASNKCIQCNSKNDLNCINVVSVFPPVTCENKDDRCFTRIIDGYTERGCVASLSSLEQQNCYEHCLFCTNRPVIVGEKRPCNFLTFPNRLECHSCEGTQEQCGVKPIGDKIICPKYVLDDKCYIRRKGKTITRGCTSDFPDCLIHACYLCDESGCNNFTVTNDNVPEYNSSATITTNFILASLFTIIIKVIS